MTIFLHTPASGTGLTDCYKRALLEGEEILIISAYLTDWSTELRLNNKCRFFRFVTGKDFGITRKAACRAVMKWLPRGFKSQFLVATQISGFHPKAVFWKSQNGESFAIVGSSNLTVAAFNKNYEVNITMQVTNEEFEAARRWVEGIIDLSVPVSEPWLKKYSESSLSGHPGSNEMKADGDDSGLVNLKLPIVGGVDKLVEERRQQLKEYRKNRAKLEEMFSNCANRKISSTKFYQGLPSVWGGEVGGRLQAPGWERQGKKSDFHALSSSYMKIIAAPSTQKDDVVSRELDLLAKAKNPARGAFLSEMLCLKYPGLYPVLNNPVKKYIDDVGFAPPRGASEGDRYINLARTLRASLRQNPNYPAKNIAELDTVIWSAYRD
jgi:HKD family nuclease